VHPGTETIKLILGVGEPLVGRLLHYDALNMTFKTFKIRRDPKWAIGAPHPTIKGLIDYEEFCAFVAAPLVQRRKRRKVAISPPSN